MVRVEDTDAKPRPRVSRLQDTRLGTRFLNRRFFHYTWIGVLISLLNILLLWLLIDVFKISTVVSSTLVVFGNFILRYVLLDFFKSA